jgi:hypothetical protein
MSSLVILGVVLVAVVAEVTAMAVEVDDDSAVGVASAGCLFFLFFFFLLLLSPETTVRAGVAGTGAVTGVGTGVVAGCEAVAELAVVTALTTALAFLLDFWFSMRSLCMNCVWETYTRCVRTVCLTSGV